MAWEKYQEMQSGLSNSTKTLAASRALIANNKLKSSNALIVCQSLMQRKTGIAMTNVTAITSFEIVKLITVAGITFRREFTYAVGVETKEVDTKRKSPPTIFVNLSLNVIIISSGNRNITPSLDQPGISMFSRLIHFQL